MIQILAAFAIVATVVGIPSAFVFMHRRRRAAHDVILGRDRQFFLETPDPIHDAGMDRIHDAMQHSTSQPWRN